MECQEYLKRIAYSISGVDSKPKGYVKLDMIRATKFGFKTVLWIGEIFKEFP